jgi:2-phospho-L-lactate/phosphoenolpyruvate guanylyltransferase
VAARTQATVLKFDTDDGSGTVILDDGTTEPFGTQAFLDSGLRLLRPGQRVRLIRDAAGVITTLTVVTLPVQ